MPAHQHDHSSGHDHSHAPAGEYGRAFAIGITLNLAFVAIEAAYGILADSM
ncbi:cation transporter, partial [Corallococcus exiguus]|nr:cation transporter [Corallococcus exiguus]